MSRGEEKWWRGKRQKNIIVRELPSQAVDYAIGKEHDLNHLKDLGLGIIEAYHSNCHIYAKSFGRFELAMAQKADLEVHVTCKCG